MVSADSTWNTHDMRIRGASGHFAEVDSLGRLVVAGGVGGGVSQEDGSEFTPGASDFTPIGGYREDTPTQLADGEGGAVRLTEDRELIVHVANSGGGGGGEVEGDVAHDAVDSGNPVKIGGVAKSFPSAVSAGDRAELWMNLYGAPIISGLIMTDSDARANIHGLPRTNSSTAEPLASAGYLYNGSTWDRVRGDTTNGLDVDVTRLPTAVENAFTTIDTTPVLRVAVFDDDDNQITSFGGGSGGGGDATLAEQQTQTAHLSAIETAVEILDNAISGSEMQVDVVGALPAGSNLIGLVSAGYNTDAIYQGATARTVGFAAISASSSGNNTLLAAQGASNKIRVHSAILVASDAVTVRFESGANGTALTGQMELVANTGFVLPFNPLGWFETAANTLLNLELSAAVSVGGAFQYSVVQ